MYLTRRDILLEIATLPLVASLPQIALSQATIGTGTLTTVR